MEEKYQVFDGKMQLEKKIKDLNSELSKTETLLHLDELKNRRRLLRRMGYITASNVIETKGRVACEITCGDSLVLTEMIFNGVFNELSVEQSIALASCFTCDERVFKSNLD
jgi:ATP-dependent RNA helicase DOB1